MLSAIASRIPLVRQPKAPAEVVVDAAVGAPRSRAASGADELVSP
jgi:hypothetical protein